MSENEIMEEWMDGETSKNQELRDLHREMDSVDNLNTNPVAVRIAGYKAALVAFKLGVRFAEKSATPSGEKEEKC